LAGTETNINSITLGDIDDDSIDEIIIGTGDQGSIVVLNNSGKLLFSYYINKDQVGIGYGKKPGMDVGDINNDGILDVAVLSRQGYIDIFQEASCSALFNDSTSYNMTWNNVLRKWQINKSFLSIGTYEYNITCSKGGYESQIESSQIEIAPNVAPNNPSPVLVSVDGLNSTRSDLNCSAIISDNDGDDLNVSVSWYSDGILNLVVDYDNNYLNGSEFSAILGFGNTTKDENWNCSIRVYDKAFYSGWGNSSNLTILNSYPQIEFIDPTRDSGNVTSDTSIDVNVSIIEKDLDEIIYNWNGTNFSVMNDSLVLIFNFDNVSALGENDTVVVDVSVDGNNGSVVGGEFYCC